MLRRLVMVNGLVLLVLTTLDAMDRLTGGSVSAVWPAEGAWMLATSWKMEVLASRPWSVVTHMFTHQGIWHFIMNMLLLTWMGRLYHAEVGSRRLLSTYLAGALQASSPISCSPTDSSPSKGKARSPLGLRHL